MPFLHNYTQKEYYSEENFTLAVAFYFFPNFTYYQEQTQLKMIECYKCIRKG